VLAVIPSYHDRCIYTYVDAQKFPSESRLTSEILPRKIATLVDSSALRSTYK
jgi:hypothetical protein